MDQVHPRTLGARAAPGNPFFTLVFVNDGRFAIAAPGNDVITPLMEDGISMSTVLDFESLRGACVSRADEGGVFRSYYCDIEQERLNGNAPAARAAREATPFSKIQTVFAYGVVAGTEIGLLDRYLAPYIRQNTRRGSATTVKDALQRNRHVGFLLTHGFSYRDREHRDVVLNVRSCNFDGGYALELHGRWLVRLPAIDGRLLLALYDGNERALNSHPKPIRTLIRRALATIRCFPPAKRDFIIEAIRAHVSECHRAS